MKIEHLAVWVRDLEKMRIFYEKYFEAKSNEKYINLKKEFSSYFLSFDSGCRLELMHNPIVAQSITEMPLQHLGLIHFAIAATNREAVNRLTEELRKDGYKVVGEPRTTGDGYYESVILDPENNQVEIVAE